MSFKLGEKSHPKSRLNGRQFVQLGHTEVNSCPSSDR